MPAKKKDIDWKAVENEYITDASCSFRSLSEKYGISASAIHSHAKDGGWAEKREHFENKSGAAALEKLIAERAKTEARRLTKIYKATDKLIDKVARAIEKVNPLNTLAIRQLSSSLKEVRVMEGIDKGVPEADEGGVVLLPTINALEPPPEDREGEALEDGKSNNDSGVQVNGGD